MARCQDRVWPRFRAYSLSRQQGPDTPRTPDDHYCLALGHWSGQLDGNHDPAGAAMHAQVAAQQSHAGAQGLLGFLYSRGIGVKQDQAAAIVMWRKAAAQGHADSINALADAYDRGQGVPADKAEAQRLYRLAAERGSTEARKTNRRYRADRYEAYTAWVRRKNEYDDCKRANTSHCPDPGPAP